MRQNRHCQIYWQISHPEKNVMRSTAFWVRGCKSPLLLRGKTSGLRTRCGQRTEAADAVRTAGTNFLSAPSLIKTLAQI